MEIVFLIADISGITSIVLTLILSIHFDRLEKKNKHLTSIIEEIAHIATNAEEESIKVSRKLDEHITKSKKDTQRAFFKGYNSRKEKTNNV